MASSGSTGESSFNYISYLEMEIKKSRTANKKLVAKVSNYKKRLSDMDSDHHVTMADRDWAYEHIKKLEANLAKQKAAKRAYKLAFKELHARSKPSSDDDEEGSSSK